MSGPVAADIPKVEGFEKPVDVRTAAQFLGISPSLVYAYVERKQIPHYRMMGRRRVFLGASLKMMSAEASECRSGGVQKP
jgi:excisionase family DNA binding protein